MPKLFWINANGGADFANTKRRAIPTIIRLKRATPCEFSLKIMSPSPRAGGNGMMFNASFGVRGA